MYQLPKEYCWTTFAAPELNQRVKSRAAIALARRSAGSMRVVLTGPPGAGKTSLALAIGREAMRRRDVFGMYIEAIELDCARSESRLGQAPEDIQRALEVPVLVLDELGGEAAVSKDVEQVIKRRYREGRQTIVVAALDAAAVGHGYSGGVQRRLEESVWIDCAHERQPPAYEPAIRCLPERSPFAGGPPRRPLLALPDDVTPSLAADICAAMNRTRKAG